MKQPPAPSEKNKVMSLVVDCGVKQLVKNYSLKHCKIETNFYEIARLQDVTAYETWKHCMT